MRSCLGDLVTHAVLLFGTLGVVPAIQCADQVAGDAADVFKMGLVSVLPSAAGTFVLDDARVAADRVSVHRMIDAAVVPELMICAERKETCPSMTISSIHARDAPKASCLMSPSAST